MSLAAIIFLTFVNALNYLDRYLMAALLPAVSAEYALTQTQAGWLVAAFVPGYVIFSPIFGYLGDRASRPRLMACGVAAWSAATLLTAFAPGFGWLVVARVLVGVGEASFVAIAPSYIKDRISDPVSLNSALAIFFSATPVGSALGYVLGGAMVERFSWPSAFLVGAVPGFVCAAWLLRLPETPRKPQEIPSLGTGVRLIARSHLFWYALGGYILNSFALNGVAAFVSSHGQNLEMSLEEIGVWFGAILVVAGILGTLGGGRIASRLAAASTRKLMVLFVFAGISSLLAAPFLLGAFSADSKALFLGLCFVAEVLVFAAVAPINSVIVLVAPQAFVALSQGLTILMINLLGGLPAPVVVGFVADVYSLRAGLCALAPVLLASGAIWTLGGYKSKNKEL